MAESKQRFSMPMNNDDQAVQLWQRARRHRPTARLLDEVLLDRACSQILLLHREELFPRIDAELEPNLSFQFGASALVLLSHPLRAITRSTKILDEKRRTHWYQGPRQERASEVVRELDEVTRETLIDNVALESLKLVQSNSALRTLVTQNDPITREDLKRSVGDYSSLALDPLKTAALQLFQRVLSGKRSKKALHQIAIEVDTLKDFLDLERFQLMLVQRSLAHYHQLIRGLRIPESLWKDIILALHSDNFLEHVGPLYLWCTKCPESGVLASVRTTQLLRPLRCPRCGRTAYTATALFPSDALADAIRLRDGMLGAAIGWQLTKKHISFRHSVPVGGTELDFLVSRGPVKCLIECKMNHQLKERPQLLATLRDNVAQLDAHVLAAQSAGINLHSAVCVVNHGRCRLAALRPYMDASQKSTVPMKLMSYEDFLPWISKSPFAQGGRPRRTSGK
jgi:hypothetical protein